jgi:hypothetical protein
MSHVDRRPGVGLGESPDTARLVVFGCTDEHLKGVAALTSVKYLADLPACD